MCYKHWQYREPQCNQRGGKLGAIISNIIVKKKFQAFSYRKNEGFSLLELLIYISILSVLMVIIANTFISLSRGNGQSQARSEVDSTLRFATELVRQDIKNASAVTTPATGSSSSSLVLTRGGATIVYDVVNGTLRRTVNAGTPQNITGPNIIVSTPTFIRIENTNMVFNVTDISIQILMTFAYNSTSPAWSYSATLQSTVNLY